MHVVKRIAVGYNYVFYSFSPRLERMEGPEGAPPCQVKAEEGTHHSLPAKDPVTSPNRHPTTQRRRMSKDKANLQLPPWIPRQWVGKSSTDLLGKMEGFGEGTLGKLPECGGRWWFRLYKNSPLLLKGNDSALNRDSVIWRQWTVPTAYLPGWQTLIPQRKRILVCFMGMKF